ncbi:MAG: response regulator transcription factor [Desulfosarcinaceae bacterium]|nr:response regulator transcription factor [Desulfosarcinaceae bacterium]
MDSPIPIFIVGRNQLQNDLLQSYIESLKDFTCTCMTSLGGDLIDAVINNEKTILIIDASVIDIDTQLGNGSGLKEAILSQRCHPVLFNVDADQEIEQEAIRKGIRGVFYSSEPIEHLCKGLERVLAGELWFPRSVLSAYIVSATKRGLAPDPMPNLLTVRERDILLRLASGASNQEIADHYNISPHTVKTHIYNCYKKIGVSNRMQATLWVSRYL